MGDFNIDIKDKQLCNTKWKHAMEINDLKQLIKEPTRITANSATTIHDLYASKPGLVADLSVPNIAVRDHFPIQFTCVSGKPNFKRNFHTTIQYRSYKAFNEEHLLFDMTNTMTNINISPVNSAQNFETSIQHFNTVLTSILQSRQSG